MKRGVAASSDSLGDLMSICPNSTDDGNNQLYTRDFQTMMDGYDDDNCIDQESCRSLCSEKKRRLRVDQVKALEKNFEVENKLEPERKVKLAQELGLQPRQVAVWFQNRRARWKTKQLERDYGVLKANYDGLKLDFEKLRHENEALIKEIQELKSKINDDGSLADSEENPHLPDKDPNFASNNEIISGEPSVFIDLKDVYSDSDSSAILNEDNISPTDAIHHHHHEFLEIDDQNINVFQFQESKATTGFLGDHGHKNYHHHHPQQLVKIEEHNFFSEESCSTFFSDDQAPSLHWYEWS